MSKHLFANEKVMTQYLGALLSEEEQPVDELQPVAKLLERIHAPMSDSPPVVKAESVKELEKTENQANIKDIVEKNEKQLALDKTPAQRQDDYFDGEFQALFFEVAGLTLAVPLKSLGGIHQLGEVNQLFGKPKWFKGVMLNRDENLNVVDTARWVMPEKFDKKLEESLNYQYLITLGDSQWGLLAEKLVNNITLRKEDVKWRGKTGKRPWLAGVIKDKMCALIDVDNLNQLLEQGLDSREQ
ncbi:chemotaxis protein CheW [Pseudoalteromonas mariniglutinosa]|uniref:chemotaxis protein CheW n=1 Tax=Pseudoalteromonas mariniglutinosa TaxID=206042 RepID=UPI00384B138D